MEHVLASVTPICVDVSTAAAGTNGRTVGACKRVDCDGKREVSIERYICTWDSEAMARPWRFWPHQLPLRRSESLRICRRVCDSCSIANVYSRPLASHSYTPPPCVANLPKKSVDIGGDIYTAHKFKPTCAVARSAHDTYGLELHHAASLESSPSHAYTARRPHRLHSTQCSSQASSRRLGFGRRNTTSQCWQWRAISRNRSASVALVSLGLLDGNGGRTEHLRPAHHQRYCLLWGEVLGTSLEFC